MSRNAATAPAPSAKVTKSPEDCVSFTTGAIANGAGVRGGTGGNGRGTRPAACGRRIVGCTVFTCTVVTWTIETVRSTAAWKTARTWMAGALAVDGRVVERALKSGAPCRGGSSVAGFTLSAGTTAAGTTGGAGGTGGTGTETGGTGTETGGAGGGTAGCCGAASGRICAAACAAVATAVAIEVAAEPVVWVTPAESPGLAMRTEMLMLQPTQTVVPATGAAAGGGVSGQSHCQFHTIVTAPAAGSGVGGSGIVGTPSQFQYQFQIKV